VEAERQLLFEAMAYLHEDVRHPVPDIGKIQLDIKRLKDFIAYKVDHAEVTLTLTPILILTFILIFILILTPQMSL
jgi:hypothetical protein